MDRVADAAWRAAAAPFDGLTACTGSNLPTGALYAATVRVTRLLERAFPDATLHTSEDWLEHDGFVNEPEQATWGDLRAALESESAFIDASPTDTYVRRAWLGHPSFYLRWHYYDEGDSSPTADPPAGGDLDVTADADFVTGVVRELRAMGVDAVTETAGTFFKDRHNG